MSVDVDALRRAIVNFETDVSLDELGALLTELEQLRDANEQLRNGLRAREAAELAACQEFDEATASLTSLRQKAQAVVDAMCAYIDYKNLEHDDPCPEDDTCDCEHVRSVDASLTALRDELVESRAIEMNTVERERHEAQLEVLRRLQTWNPGEGMGGVLCQRIDDMISELELQTIVLTENPAVKAGV